MKLDRFVTTVWFWLVGAGVLAKLWRAVGLWQEARANDGFVWLPLGVAAEIVFAACVVGVIVGLARLAPRGVAYGVGIVLALADIAWLALNLLSFTITQAPITFQRLRGDEGVTFAERSLVRFEDVVPSIAYAVVAVVLVVPAIVAGRRFAVSTRAFAAALLVACLAYAADAVFFRDKNFGVADHPAFTLVSSFVHGYVDEHRAPVLKKETAGDLKDLLASRTPVAETAPPPRAKAEMKNVIVFFSEGIGRKHTSLAGTDATPNLLRRFHESGLEMTRYHSPYHKSIAAIYSFVCSDFPPPNATNIVEINARIDCGELSDVLAEHDVHAGLFHGGDFGFYDKLMLLGMRHYEIMEDARVMSDPLTYDENEWGVDDRAMVDHVLAWIDTLPPGDRFGAVMIPITAHWPYWIPGDVDVRYPGLSAKSKFLSAVHFLDEAFERLMVGLEERGIANDTAVIYLADHGETVGERPRESAGRRLTYEPSLSVPFVILAPGMWPGGSQSDRLGSHVDLVPTMLDLLGFPPDPRHHGTSLLAPDREPGRIFIGASNGPKWVGFIDGYNKFVVNRTTGVREDYDLRADPDERHDLIETIPLAQADELEQEALAYADGHQAEIKGTKKRDEEIDIEQRFIATASVRIDGVECAPVPGDPGGARTCPSGGFTGRKKIWASGMHDCVVVEPPAHGVIELEVEKQPWLPFLSRVRIAETGPLRTDGADDVLLEAWTDGELQSKRTVTPVGHVRMSFASPRDRLLLRIGGNGVAKRDVCIALTERGWRNRTAGPPPAATDRGPSGE